MIVLDFAYGRVSDKLGTILESTREGYLIASIHRHCQATGSELADQTSIGGVRSAGFLSAAQSAILLFLHPQDTIETQGLPINFGWIKCTLAENGNFL